MANRITVTLTVSVQLSGADASVVTLSNLAGFELLPASVSLDLDGFLFCRDSGQSRAGLFSTKSLELTLQLCADETMEVGHLYVIAFTATNPPKDRASPDILIAAAGQRVVMVPALIIKDHATVLGVAFGASPMTIVVPEFLTRHIVQATPVTSVRNVITMTLSSSISLSSTLSSKISITHLTGLLVAARTVSISDVGAGVSFSALVCSSYSLVPGEGDWSTSTIIFRVCDGMTIQLNTPYIFSFEFINPGFDQDSPPVEIHARNTMAELFPVLMHKSHEPVLGVIHGADPLQEP